MNATEEVGREREGNEEKRSLFSERQRKEGVGTGEDEDEEKQGGTTGTGKTGMEQVSK